MNTNKLSLQWRLFYFQYRSFFAPVSIIAVCVVLFFVVVIPQIQQFFSSQNQLNADQQRLQILHQNFQQITGFNNQKLDDDYATVVNALPVEKNGVSILDSISHAASVTNVSLRDYNFEVGKLTPLTGEPPIEILLAVNANIDNLRKFIHEINNSLPLATVTSVSAESSTSATLTVDFYAKISNKPNLDPNHPIQLLTQQDLATIDKLATWQNSVSAQE